MKDRRREPRARRSRRVFLSTILFLFLLLPALPAWGRNWRIANFHDTVTLAPDGSLVVMEEIAVVFTGEFQGIHRRIPVDYPGPGGTNYSLFLSVREVTDGAGNALRYKTEIQKSYETLTIYVPGAVDTTKTVDILYSVPNAVRFFPDHDELYWNVTGNDWPVPIDEASATVRLPSDAAGSIQAQAFTGAYGARDREATTAIDGATASFSTTNPLPMRGGLTIDLYLPKGILRQPDWLTQATWLVRSNPVLFLPLVALAVMFPLWWFKGKDPDAGLSVAPMYEPPPGLSPAEAGTLVADAVEPRDITCTVVDLAVRGFLKIEETGEKHLLWGRNDYIFHLLKPPAEWTGLNPHEQVLLMHMFEGGQQARLSELKNRFYVAVPVIKRNLIASLRRKNMYSVDPESAGLYTFAGAALIAAPFLVLQGLGKIDLLASVSAAVPAIAVAGAIVFLFGRKMTAKSLLGVRTAVKVLGFQDFMNRVDADRLSRLSADSFEKYLPYAMALGVEHRWAQAFKGIIQPPPQWYVGPAYPGMGWNPILFTNSIHSMAADLHTVMTTAPRASSSGSGFSGLGGGFSGGGFGGGGGDAF